jgi:hypothetical protein
VRAYHFEREYHNAPKFGSSLHCSVVQPKFRGILYCLCIVPLLMSKLSCFADDTAVVNKGRNGKDIDDGIGTSMK